MNEPTQWNDDERIAGLAYIGRQIEQRLIALEKQQTELKKLMDVLHDKFSARPVAVTWLVALSIFVLMAVAGYVR